MQPWPVRSSGRFGSGRDLKSSGVPTIACRIRPDAHRDQVLLDGFAHRNAGVETFAHDVGQTLVSHEFDRNIGIIAISFDSRGQSTVSAACWATIMRTMPDGRARMQMRKEVVSCSGRRTGGVIPHECQMQQP